MKKFGLFIFFIFITSPVFSQEALTAIRDNSTKTNVANVSHVGSRYGLVTDSAPASVIYNGQITVTTAGTSVQLSATSIPIRSVCIKAMNGNTGKMYVGDVTVASTNGYELPKDVSVCLDINDLDLIYIDSGVNGEKISYLAVN